MVSGQAFASVVRLDFVDDARVEYLAAAGEVNVVTIARSGSTYTVTDSAPLTAGSGCTQVSAGQATCPATGVRRVTARGGDLNDRITVSATAPNGVFINGGPGDDDLTGGPGSDQLVGGTEDDALDGGAGDDLLDGGTGDDLLDGGSGSDTASYERRTAPVRTDLTFKIGGQSGGEIASGEQDSILTTVENAIGGAGDDEIVGGEGDNILSGGPAGADIICGGLGVDTVDYADRTTPVRVSLDGSLPTDPNLGGTTAAREDCRELGPPPVLPQPPGVGARDCVRNDGADADGDGVAEEGDCVGEDTENIRGGLSGDTLIGNDPDPLIGLAPRVEPRGRNRLTGGGGNDRLDGRFGPDVFEGGSGIDTVTYAGRSAGVTATIDGVADDGDSAGPIGGDFDPGDGHRDDIGADIENVEGGAGNDVLRGDADANRLDAGPGDDTIFGGDGAGADDTLTGGPGSDRVLGGGGDDLVVGGDGDDFLDGGAGADQLAGEAGNDRLAGRAGPDYLGGGDGSDAADYSDATMGVSAGPNGLPG